MGVSKVAKANSGERVVLQLDTRIALEAIILNRLQRMPVNRRQEWLRGLLVQGFRQECQVLRGMTDGTKQPPTMELTPRLAGARKGSVITPVAVPMKSPPASPTSHLRYWVR